MMCACVSWQLQRHGVYACVTATTGLVGYVLLPVLFTIPALALAAPAWNRHSTAYQRIDTRTQLGSSLSAATHAIWASLFRELLVRRARLLLLLLLLLRVLLLALLALLLLVLRWLLPVLVLLLLAMAVVVVTVPSVAS